MSAIAESSLRSSSSWESVTPLSSGAGGETEEHEQQHQDHHEQEYVEPIVRSRSGSREMGCRHSVIHRNLLYR